MKASVLFLILFISGCFIGFNDLDYPGGYVKYGTMPEREVGQMHLFPYAARDVLEFYTPEVWGPKPFWESNLAGIALCEQCGAALDGDLEPR